MRTIMSWRWLTKCQKSWHKITNFFYNILKFQKKIMKYEMQPIFGDTPDSIAHPLWLVPTIEMIKYSFVLYHQDGRRTSQEYQTNIWRTVRGVEY